MNYLRKILSVMFIGVLSTLIFTLVQIAPAYACNSAIPSNCHFVLDASSTGYVFNHGAKISVSDPSPGINPTITVRDGNNQPTTFTTGDYLMIDSTNKNVYVGYPGATGFQEYLMFTSSTSGMSIPLTDPPTLQSAVGTTITFTYDDGNGNTITTPAPVPLVSADPPSGVTWPVKKTSDQPINNVAIQCIVSGVTAPRGGSSGDYVCDNWKTPTGLNIPYTDSHGFLVNYKWLCGNDPDAPFNSVPANRLDWPCPNGNKDVYVEVDWMQNHAPSIQALKDVREVFRLHNINLHIQLGQEVLHKTALSGPNNGNDLTDFTKIKTIYFGPDVGVVAPSTYNAPVTDLPPGQPGSWGWSTCGNSGQYCVTDLLTAKRQVFHYVLFGDSQGSNQFSSGISEVASLSPFGATNDDLISLGRFSYGQGSIDQQEGTLMHELGHALGLGHSGPYYLNPDTQNCKPNYLSVMSYTRQFSDLFTVAGVGRALNYSSESSAKTPSFTIDEQRGADEIPVTALSNQYTVFGLPSGGMSMPTNASFPDWDSDFPGPLGTQGELAEQPPEISMANVVLNVGTWTMSTPGSGTGSVTVICPSSTPTQLNTYDDWSGMKYDMTTTSSYADGAGTGSP